MQKIFNYYQDPSHGWVKVPKSILRKLGIEKDISKYSYENGEFAYLEEDRDVLIFMEAMKKTNHPVKFKEFHTNRSSIIRNYNGY